MILSRISEYYDYNKPFRLFVIGKRGVGKSTYINKFCEAHSFAKYEIDGYRHCFSDGTLDGEEYAYFNFLRDVKSNPYQNQVIECTGLSKRFTALFSKYHICMVVMLYCTENERKERIKLRNRNGYSNPPFPYTIGKEKEFDWHTDLFVNASTLNYNFDEIMGLLYNKLDYFQHNAHFETLDKRFDETLKRNKSL